MIKWVAYKHKCVDLQWEIVIYLIQHIVAATAHLFDSKMKFVSKYFDAI